MPDADTLLRIYLNDHLAGATLGLALARRTLRSNPGGELGEFLSWLATQIAEDRASLVRVLEAAGVRRNPVKEGAARVAEVVGRLKLNGRVRGYSELSRLLELEGLAAGITAKRALWVSLGQLAAADSRLAGFDFGALAERAESQLAEVERQRLRAVPLALARPAG